MAAKPETVHKDDLVSHGITDIATRTGEELARQQERRKESVWGFAVEHGDHG